MTLTFLGSAVGVNAMYKRGLGRRLYLSDEGAAFKVALTQEVRKSVKRGFGVPAGIQCRVRVKFFYETERNDLDSGIKPVLDCLQAGGAFGEPKPLGLNPKLARKKLWGNDRQVKILLVSRHTDKLQPRIEIEVESLVGRPQEVLPNSEPARGEG